MSENPPCPNHLAGSCERSDVVVQGERDHCFILYCRTCRSVNVWPADERHARYQGYLKKQARLAEIDKASQRQREYSYGGLEL